MSGWATGFGMHQGIIPNQDLMSNPYVGWNVNQFGPAGAGLQIPTPVPPVQYPNFITQLQSSGGPSYPNAPVNTSISAIQNFAVPGATVPIQSGIVHSNLVESRNQMDTVSNKQVLSVNQENPQCASQELTSGREQLYEGVSKPVLESKIIDQSNVNISIKFSKTKKANDDSGSSIGGSCSDLTGDEDEDDPEELKVKPRNKQEMLRLKLLQRENHVIKFWLSRKSLVNPKVAKFPDIYRLRNIKNLDKRAKSAFELLFSKSPRHLKPEFVKAANTRPDLGYFHVRCSWNSFQHTVHGYGNTVEAAENDAGIKALVTVFGEDEYKRVNEITQDAIFGNEGLDMTRIHAHLSLSNRKEPKSFGKGSPTFEYELTNQPSLIKLNPPPEAQDFTVPKTQFNLLSKKIPLYGKEDSRTAPASCDSVIPFQSIKKLKTFSNLTKSAIPALGSLFVGDCEPSPKYTTVSTGLQPSQHFKVECVANKKYFVAEAPTEEAAKNAAAVKALKFIIGVHTFDQLSSRSSRPAVTSVIDNPTA